MGINFHITSVREGTIFNVMQFLSLEKVTGVLGISFGHHIPEAAISYVSGKAVTAEFGDIAGDAVLDLLLCQEYAIREVNFGPGRITRINEQALIVRASSLSGALLLASKDVDKCQSRPFIFGMLPVYLPSEDRTESLLQVFHNFARSKDFLASVPRSAADKKAPLPQCVLLYRALAQNVIHYQTPLVSLKSLRQLLETIQPLSDSESNNLRVYMRSLLPHPRATHMPIDRFHAFASAVESIAHRRAPEIADQVRRSIYRIIQGTSKLSEETADVI